MNSKLKTALGISALALAAHASAQITFYENAGFRGRVFTTQDDVRNFQRVGFNDRASSVIVDEGRWQVCEDANFGGHCVVLTRGSYDALRGMALNDRISSVRRVGDQAQYTVVPAPMDQPNYMYRRRPEERYYEANVNSVHAVLGPASQRCWVERQEVTESRPNVGGAVVGAVLGGILGHQIGGGTGRDLATAGGVVAGAAIGSNVNRDDGTDVRDVRRCASRPSGPPDFWDVSYTFRGIEHRTQMTAPPGPTITVNENGEPRG